MRKSRRWKQVNLSWKLEAEKKKKNQGAHWAANWFAEVAVVGAGPRSEGKVQGWRNNVDNWLEMPGGQEVVCGEGERDFWAKGKE